MSERPQKISDWIAEAKLSPEVRRICAGCKHWRDFGHEIGACEYPVPKWLLGRIDYAGSIAWNEDGCRTWETCRG